MGNQHHNDITHEEQGQVQPQAPTQSQAADKDASPLLSRRAFIKLAVAGGIVASGAGYVAAENNLLRETSYTFSFPQLSDDHDGLMLCHLSDIHNAYHFGSDADAPLIRMISAKQPQAIVITGDLMDKRDPNIQGAQQFIRTLTQIAPVYYVTGNHEKHPYKRDYSLIDLYKDDLIAAGITYLDNQVTEFPGVPEIALVGIEDPFNVSAFKQVQREHPHQDPLRVDKTVDGGYYGMTPDTAWYDLLNNLCATARKQAPHTILLSHRPERFHAYVHEGVDLALTGHTHAGQVRAPFVGALFAPNQGFFPQYDYGVFQEVSPKYQKPCSMVISAGIGSSIIPLRTCNRPEVVFISLCKTKESM